MSCPYCNQPFGHKQDCQVLRLGPKVQLAPASKSSSAPKPKSPPAQPSDRAYVQRIVCAASRLGNEIICGARHFDSIMVRQIQMRGESGEWRTSEQGFIDQWGQFLTREEAWAIAEKNGQIIRDPDWQRGSLHSEHLY